MEATELQKRTMEEAFFFKKEIDKKIEYLFTKRYKDLSIHIDGLTEFFFIDLSHFKDLIKNTHKTYLKFYYTEKDGLLSLGLSFSDDTECDIKLENTDFLYALKGKIFIKQDITDLVNTFDKGIGTKLHNHTEEKDTLSYYTLDEINKYIKAMENLYLTIYDLKFCMLQYCPTNLSIPLAKEFTKRNNRISFCVHSIFSTPEKIYNEATGFDMGNLRP